MDTQKSPINMRERRRRRFSLAAERVSLVFEEWVVVGGGEALRAGLELARRPFEWVAWTIRRGLLWPLQDRTGSFGTALAGIAAVLVLALGAFALLSGGSEEADPEPVAEQIAIAPEPPATTAPEPPAARPQPTLQGAAPVFEPARRGNDAKVSSAEPTTSPAPAGADPATATIGSGAGASASTSAAPQAPGATQSAVGIDGPAAGPAAIAVAEDFADAFVLYETGGEESRVRRAFAATATPELSKSLLRRPPRLPANVEVPEAKVVNVVAGPSHGGVYSVSVSLLRVGLTSELRLDMEKLKNDWRVTNVLG